MSGNSIGIKTGLNHRQILQLQRQTALFESLLEYRKIVMAETEQYSHLLASALGITVDI